MERRVITGQSELLWYDANGNPNLVDPVDFRLNYTFQLDRYDQVRLLTQSQALYLGFDPSDPYNARAVIGGYFAVIDYPPASQTAPDQQPADKAGPDPFAGIDRPPAQAPLKPKAWLLAEHERRQQQRDVPKDITTYGKQLHNAAVVDVRRGRLTNVPSARRFENLLHELDLFPKIQRRTKHARKTHD
jgi:hypothetical protein